MEYKWDKSLETGHEMIDKQHQELFRAINELLRACENGDGEANLKKSLDFLNEYTIKHFFDEEQLQQKYQYPDYPNHKAYHEGFKKVVRDFSVKLIMQGVSDSLIQDVQAQIGDWLVKHIKGQDVKVAAHIKSRT
jgi:hemerythrin